MNNTKMILLAVMLSAPAAFADNSGGPKDGPCSKIWQACTAAGFTKDGAAGKDLRTNCMKPIMDGQSVEGVTVDAANVQACKDMKGKHGGHHHPHGKGGGAN